MPVLVLHVAIWDLLLPVFVARIPHQNAVWIRIMIMDGVAVRFVEISFPAESIHARVLVMKGCAAAARS